MIALTPVDSPGRTLWDTAQESQEKLAARYVKGKEGLAAFKELRKLLEPYWKHEPAVPHPLSARLLMASEWNYQRLTYLASKLHALATITNAEFFWQKLGVAREYLGAILEIDFILRLQRSGLPILISRTSGVDIETQIGGKEVAVEVTSLREDEQIYALKAFMAFQSAASRGGAVLGGNLERIPRSKKQIAELVARIEEAANQASSKDETVIVDLPGITLRLYPERVAPAIPEGLRELQAGTAPPNTTKLIRTIRKKAKKYSDVETLVVVIYDWAVELLGSNAIRDFLSLDVDAIFEEFQNVAGLIVICPGFERLKTIRIDRDAVTYLEHSPKEPLEGKSERIIVWKNSLHPHLSVVELIIESVTDSKPIRLPWLELPT